MQVLRPSTTTTLTTTAAAAAAAFFIAIFSVLDGVNGCVATCQTFAAGRVFTCALTNASSNNVRCFGDNRDNQLGDSLYGSNSSSIASPMPPQDVDLNGARAVQIATGFLHTCVLTATGGVLCWGQNDYSGQSTNQLGYGSSPPASPPHDTDIQFDSPNIQAVQVVGGYRHSCVLLIDGRVSCFGRNIYNQIGSINTAETNSPPIEKKIYIQMPNNDKVKQICAGRYHSCALSLQGEVACWGRHNYGQLGYLNNRSNVWNPSSVGYVSLTSNSSLKSVKIACGYYHTAVLLENGKVKTFGRNNYGQLGYSYSDDVGFYQVPSYFRPENGYEDEFVRLYANNDSIVRDIACGGWHTCVIDLQDQLFCIGHGETGKLGYGNALQVGGAGHTQVFEAGVVEIQVESVESADSHTCIQYKNSLDMKCFGSGSFGALGSGNTNNLGNNPNETPNQLDPINLGTSPMSPSSCTICIWAEILAPTLSPTISPTASTATPPTLSPTISPTASTATTLATSATLVATSTTLAPFSSSTQAPTPNDSDERTDVASSGDSADVSGGGTVTAIFTVASVAILLLCAVTVALLLRNSISRKKNSKNVEWCVRSSSAGASTGSAGLSSPRGGGGGGGGNDRSSKRQSRAMHSNRASKRSSVRLPRSGAVGGATGLRSTGAGASHSEYSDLSRLQNPVSKSRLNYDFAPVPSEQGANASSSSLSSYEMNFAQSQLVADGDSNYADLSKVSVMSAYSTPHLAIAGNAAASGDAGQHGDYDLMELRAVPSEANDSAASVLVHSSLSASSNGGGGGGGIGNYQILKTTSDTPSSAESAENAGYTNMPIKDIIRDQGKTQYDPLPGNA